MTTRKRLSEQLERKDGFVVLAELTGGANFDLEPIRTFLSDYAAAGPGAIPAGFVFTGIALPQSPGGVANIDPGHAIARLNAEGLLGDLDCVPHVSCKDQNINSLISSLVGLRDSGVESVLALTGDKPVSAAGVFDLDSIGLLDAIRDTNNDAYLKARPQDLDKVRRLFPGAAVSPFKYTEPSQMQQYYKMEKKIARGARFLITQVGWDWKKSAELFTYLRQNSLDVPVLGNVYFLSTTTAAPRLMHDLKLAGCFVSDEFLAKLYAESPAEHMERAAQQVAMYRALGAAGVDIGGFTGFDVFTRILQRADEIGTGWERFRDNLCWPAKEAFYLYEGDRPVKLSQPRKTFHQRRFDLMHRAILDGEHGGFRAFRSLATALGMREGKGALSRLFHANETALKNLLFDCEGCGDCYLPENFGYCTLGGCEKGLANAPCGDATADGRCGNNLERICIGELIYQAAAARPGGREKLRRTINRPRIQALRNTASILNYLFARDHTRKNSLISIGETIHASIPKTGQIMRQLASLGPDAYSRPSGPLNYVRALIESQADAGADYIAVNLDAFGEQDPRIIADMMREYVRLVRRWGNGVPICLDSSSNDALIAGLKEWYDTKEPVRQPLVNSVKIYTAEAILPLKKQYDYAFIGLLMTEDKPTGPGGSHSVEELYGIARSLFATATGRFGFKPSEILFDSTVFPLAIDMPMEPGVPGYTYRAFETIRRIKADPAMKGVHCSLGISNSVRDLPGRRIGLCRAYVAKAMEYGLDAGIVNVAHRYGLTPPDPELLALVDAFARMDGSADATNRAMALMSDFCRMNRKSSV